MTDGISTPSNATKVPKLIGIGVLFIFCIVLMTLTKLPEVRITGFLQGMVQSALDPYGIYLSDHGRQLSFLKGLTYTLDHPTLELADQTRIEFDDLTVRPKLLMLLTGKMGVSARLHQGASEIALDAGGKGDKIDASLSLQDIDLGKLGVLAFAAGLKGGGIISGTGHIDGALSDLSTLNGNLDFKLKKIHLDEQNLMGFQIPSINVSEGDLTIEIRSGKLVIKSVQIGKGTDDLRVSVSGDMALNRNLNSSALNLRAVLGISDKVKQSFSILESILGSAKMSDGRYAYKLTGSLAAPMPIPDPGK